jgi:beta-lactamase regulating signal transducer with metallopeptidase domain
MPQVLTLFPPAGQAQTWVAILADFAIKGAMILTLAGIVSIACRRASAAARHLVWALAVLGLCVLPALSAVVPPWRIPLLPPAIGSEAAPEAAAMSDLFRAEVDPERILRARNGLADATATSESAVMSERSMEKTVTGRSTSAIVVLWTAGMAIVAVRLLLSLLAVWHKGRRAAPITDGAWAALAAEIAARHGIHRRVSLRVAADGTMPATWGLVRPVVLLPVEALDWPQPRLRAVLAHELAHAARGDFAVQTVARLACMLHWFNPLVWIAERRIRAECEQASDDLVLGAGLNPADYATHLFDVLMAARRWRHAPQSALAIGRRNGLEERLRAILDGERPRRSLTPRRVALSALAAACFVLPLGFVRLEARAHDAPKLDRLPQGVTIEVVAVSTHPSGPATWWGPDGTPLAKAPCDSPARVVDSPDHEVREIVARITGLPDRAAVTWHPTQSMSRGTPALEKDGLPVPELQRVVAEFDRGATTCVVHFDLAVGPWVTEQAARKSIGIERDDRAYYFGTPRETRIGTAIAIAHNVADRDVRVVALDRDGREHLPRSTSGGGAKHMKMLDAEFDLPPGQLREYQLQSRPVGRFEIKNVALQPRKAGP